MGTCLQHGTHLPLGTDTIIIARIAEEIALRHRILLAPTVPYGVSSERESDYAGTASLDRKTLHRVLNELVATWARQGLHEVILMTAHGFGPHVEALATVVSGRVRVRAVDLNAIDLSRFFGGRRPVEHAGELETSLLLHLAPRLVRPVEPREGGAVEENGPARRREPEEPVPAPGSDGVVGCPWLASAERGRLIYDYLVSTIGERLAA